MHLLVGSNAVRLGLGRVAVSRTQEHSRLTEAVRISRANGVVCSPERGIFREVWSLSSLLASPLLILSLILGLGYLLGCVSFMGFRLGVAGVLFAGLAAGAMIPQLVMPDILGSLGLVLFVYSMGLISGKGFIESLRNRGLALVSLTTLAILCGATTAFLIAHCLRLNGAQISGLFTGAATNTPALAVVLELAHSSQPGETYGIAYPFGVIGVLLCFHLFRIVFRPKVEMRDSRAAIRVKHCILGNAAHHQISIANLYKKWPEHRFRISLVRRDGETRIADDAMALALGDDVCLVGTENTLDAILPQLGRLPEPSEQADNRHIVFRRIIVSNPVVARKTIKELDFPCDCVITRIRRGDADFVPTPETRLDFGDRVRVVANKQDMEEVSRFLGDSIRGMAEMDCLTLGFGLCAGVLLGMLPIPIPGFGVFKMGYAGGPLIVALLLGYLERTGPIVWTMPVSANLTLRQIGLVLFLAVVGVHAGPGFMRTLHQFGLPLLLGGMAITLSVTLPALVAGYKLFKIPFDELLGVVSGIHTESAAVGFASRMVNTERPEHGYTSVYALSLILKVILAQILFRIVK
jgi:putative transport protein